MVIRLSLILVFLYVFENFTHAKEHISITNAPTWVKEIGADASFEPNENEASNGYYYLVIDEQNNIPEECGFFHFALKVLNNEGVKNASDISVNYDPSFQKLTFHNILLIRNDKVIDKSNTKINAFQRETGMERSLYDGSITAVVNLDDIRVGDIIEYSYSIKGYNPIFNDKFYRKANLEYSLPVKHNYFSVIASEQYKLSYALYNDAPEPKINKGSGKIKYEWEGRDIQALILDNNVPSWYDPYQQTVLSSYENWGEVVKWGLNVYKVSASAQSKINNKTNGILKGPTEELKILQAIRFVQDEVRYLGLEAGINSYKPSDPSEVMERRFGDCKDKSLLLCTMLKSIGIKSYPVLVNTVYADKVDKFLPSPRIFDHCIVCIEYKGKSYFIDPTISYQGGNLENYYIPNYEKGLPVKKGLSELIDIPFNNYSGSSVKELITIEEIGGSAIINVRSEYFGGKADEQRAYFASNSLETVEKNYLNWYSYLYPGIQTHKEINFIDQSRYTKNRIIVEEEYKVEEFWKTSEENESLMYGEIYPLEMENYVVVTKSPQRTMPYYLNYPVLYETETIVVLPEEWRLHDEFKEISGPGYNYSYDVAYDRSEVRIRHKYKTTKNHLKSEELNKYFTDHDKIKNNLSYIFTYDTSVNGTFVFSYFGGSLAILSLLLGIFFAFKVYHDYDPEPRTDEKESQQIGSWMILFAIGIIITPIRLVIQIVNTTEYFNGNIWSALVNSNSSMYNLQTAFVMSGELIYNFIYLVFSILLIIMFFKRRTSVPRFVTIYLSVTLFVIILDTYLVHQYIGSFTDAELSKTYREIARAAIAACIWIPYFNMSQRVKDTFVNRSKSTRVAYA